MKVRHGFVSNSSSSSYIAVVVKPPYSWNKQLSEEQLKQRAVFDALVSSLNLEDIGDSEEWYEQIYKRGFKDAGYGIYSHEDTEIDVCMCSDGEIRWIGFTIFDMLQCDKTVTECKQALIDIVNKECNVKLELQHIQLEVDEASSD